MSVGIVILGVAVAVLVGAIYWLVSRGIREERRDRKRLESRQAGALAAAREHPVATRADGRTVEAD